MGNAAGARFGGAHCAPRAARAGQKLGLVLPPTSDTDTNFKKTT